MAAPTISTAAASTCRPGVSSLAVSSNSVEVHISNLRRKLGSGIVESTDEIYDVKLSGSGSALYADLEIASRAFWNLKNQRRQLAALSKPLSFLICQECRLVFIVLVSAQLSFLFSLDSAYFVFCHDHLMSLNGSVQVRNELMVKKRCQGVSLYFHNECEGRSSRYLEDSNHGKGDSL